MQKNLQKIFFLQEGKYYTNNVDLKNIYTAVHARQEGYGTSANGLINEMLSNLLELVKQGLIDITSPLVLTDYGCGRSCSTNVLGEVVARTAPTIDKMVKSGASFNNIIDTVSPVVSEVTSKEITRQLRQIETYGHVTVQRFDIGIEEISAPLSQKADVVYCNDVFEHIPADDLPSFIKDLEAAGNYIVASISLRDAVNYRKIDTTILEDGAQLADKPSEGSIVLKKDASGDYIFSLHVSVFSKETWQEILGSKWHLLTAQDYTALSALNFEPSEEYRSYKKELIAKVGFADFIGFPTKVGSTYETDPILFRRTAAMQVEKHLTKLNALSDFPESSFKQRELEESKAFLLFIGADVVEDNGKWKLSKPLPQDYLSKLIALEHLSKQQDHLSNERVKAAATELISEYNSGNITKIDDYIKNNL